MHGEAVGVEVGGRLHDGVVPAALAQEVHRLQGDLAADAPAFARIHQLAEVEGAGELHRRRQVGAAGVGEVVVVDDASTDRSRGILEDYARRHPGHLRFEVNATNRRQARTFARAVDLARGEFIAVTGSVPYIALQLKQVFGLEDINDLPISYDIAWYEQKAVVVLLALLYLGVKHIRLGPTLPGFLSPNVAKVLVENFDIKPIGSVADDVAAIMAGN